MTVTTGSARASDKLAEAATEKHLACALRFNRDSIVTAARNRAPYAQRLTSVTRRRRMVRHTLVVFAATTTALLAACGSAPGQPGPHRPSSAPASSLLTGRLRASGAPARFVAMASWPLRPGIVLFDSSSGTVVRRLLPATREGMSVTGLSVGSSGTLWITYSRGPKLQAPGTLGGFPEPDSCANEIVVWHASTGHASAYLRTGHNVQISGATLSPDGKLLAFLESGCATGYDNSYLRVTDIASGRSWTIGEQIPRCHFIDPAWSANSKELVVAYAPPATAYYRGPEGSCQEPLREELVLVSAAAAQPGLRGSTVSAQAHCEITSAAGLAGGQVLAIEACGSQMYLQGAARLLLYDRQLRLVHQYALGRCTDGNDLSADTSGTAALVSAYLYCNPPGNRQPVTRLWRYAGAVLRPVVRLPQGTLAYSQMTW
jgi:hypothetical protein